MPADGHRSAEVAFTSGEALDLQAVMVLGQEGQEYRIEDPDGENPVLVYRAHYDPRAMVRLGGAQILEGEVAWRSVLLVLPESMEREAATFDFAGAVRAELAWLTAIGAVTELDAEGTQAAAEGLTAGMRYFTGQGVYDGVNCALPEVCYRCAAEGSFTSLPPSSWDVDTAVEADQAWARIKAALSTRAYTDPCDCGGQD